MCDPIKCLKIFGVDAGLINEVIPLEDEFADLVTTNAVGDIEQDVVEIAQFISPGLVGDDASILPPDPAASKRDPREHT